MQKQGCCTHDNCKGGKIEGITKHSHNCHCKLQSLLLPTAIAVTIPVAVAVAVTGVQCCQQNLTVAPNGFFIIVPATF